MDRDGANRSNQAAEQLAETTWDAYKTLVNHTLGLQRRNARFVQEMVDDSIEELRRLAERDQSMTRELLELAEDQREAFREIVEASVLDAYTNFLFAPFTPFSYYRERTLSARPGSAENEDNGRLPLEGYDELSVREVLERLEGLSGLEIQTLRSYEQRHKNRRTLMQRLDQRLF